MRIIKTISLLLCLLFLFGCAPKAEYLLAESVYDDGDGTPTRTTREYDGAGRLSAQTTEDEDFYGMGPFYERVEFEYDDQGELMWKRVYDETTCTHVTEYVNIYDDAGHLIQSDSYRDGAPDESWTYTYENEILTQTKFIHRSEYSTDTIVETFDEAGNVLRNETTVELGGSTSTGVTEYFYDGDRLIEWKSDDGRRTVYTYDASGNLERSAYYTGPETLHSYREYTCGKGTETETQYTPDGSLIVKTVRTYDANGNLVKEEYYNESGDLWQTATYTYITK